MRQKAVAEQVRLDRTLERARWATANLADAGRVLRPASPEPRRVLHLMHDFGLPSETFIRDGLAELEALGWTTWVGALLLHDRSRYPFPPDDRLLTPTPPDLRERLGLKLSPGPLRDRHRNARSFFRMARSCNPSILHAHFGWAGVDAMHAARMLRRPLLVSFHGTDLTVYPQLPEWARLYQKLVARLHYATVVSRFAEGKLRRLGYNGELHVIPAGVRLERLAFRQSAPLRNPLTLLYVGRQVRIKGLDVLLRAMPTVVNAVEDARLVAIGDGELRSEHEMLTRRLGLERRVDFLGARSHDEVIETMAGAHLVVVPSRTMPNGQAEASPVITKEALAMGVPLVATTCGGIPETVPPERRDELVAEDDADALAARILAVAREDEAAQRERAVAGRLWVEREFDWNLLARRIELIYEALAPAAATTDPADAG